MMKGICAAGRKQLPPQMYRLSATCYGRKESKIYRLKLVRESALSRLHEMEAIKSETKACMKRNHRS